MSFLHHRADPLAALALLAACLTTPAAHSQGFAAIASPPRFELRAQAGELLRSVLEISNTSSSVATFNVKTADWSFDRNHNLEFHDALTADSCRPWVALEQREIKVAAEGKMRYRFEVRAPLGTPVRECRFALLIEGREAVLGRAQDLSFPVSGRLGVIVYVAIGAAQPRLEIAGTELLRADKQIVPAVRINNSGSAHGRLAGVLTGVDAKGRKFEFIPNAVPILPGASRTIGLLIDREANDWQNLAYPLLIKGALESGEQRLPFEHRYAP